MTSAEHKTHINRIHEVSDAVKADLYTVICGDEPLTNPDTVSLVLPKAGEMTEKTDGFVLRMLMREFHDPVEAADPSNIKAVVNDRDECLLLTRAIAPHPYKTLDYTLKKLVGIECYSKEALNFFVSTPVGSIERIEDIALLRYIENHKLMKLVMTKDHQLGVDTPKDLDRVCEIIGRKIANGEIVVS
jgi:3-deoxy-manno-octulosonate cytidylyltransferase (CMP-KDO synthetase)